MSQITASERFRAILDFKPVSSLPLIEWAPYWNLTVERWESEGMPAGMNYHEIQRYFGLDVIMQNWVRPRHENIKVPDQHGGAIISSEAEYDELLESGMLFPASRINAAALAKWQEWDRQRKEQGDGILMLTFEGAFWFPRTLFGIEQHLFSFYDQPELMLRMNHDLAEYNLKCLKAFCKVAQPDFISFAEDMSYNNGAMLSEQLFDEFMLPYYDMMIPELKKLGIKAIIDSDGDITECAAWFRRAGAGGMLPLERQAGVDIVELRRKYPDLVWMGAYDKTVMHRGEAAIRAEFDRIMPAAKQGGIIISCDHQTPPGVSLEQYREYLRCFREYATGVN